MSLVLTSEPHAIDLERWLSVLGACPRDTTIEIILLAAEARDGTLAAPQSAIVRVVRVDRDLPVAELRRRGLQCSLGDIVLFPDEHWLPRMNGAAAPQPRTGWGAGV